jgi:hypothetical protein
LQHANPANLGHVIHQQNPRTTKRFAINARHKMQRFSVAPVDLVCNTYILLFNEHGASQGVTGRKIIRQRNDPTHAK